MSTWATMVSSNNSPKKKIRERSKYRSLILFRCTLRVIGSNAGTYVISRLPVSDCMSVYLCTRINPGRHWQNAQPNYFIPALLVDIVDPCHFITLSMALTLASRDQLKAIFVHWLVAFHYSNILPVYLRDGSAPTIAGAAKSEVADQAFYLAQSKYAETGPTGPSADSTTPGA